MSEITFAQAKEFLENITKKDNVAIIHHDDGDGFCSGILYYDWCKLKKAEVENFVYSIGKSKLKNFGLEKFNKIIVCDLSSSFMAEEFEMIKDKHIFYTDHHPKEVPLPKEILELLTAEQGYIPSSRTAGELTGMKPWLSLTGVITDSGHLYPENENFIDGHLKSIGMTLEKFKENISSIITNFLVYFDKNLEEAFIILQKLKSVNEVKKLRKYSEQVKDEVQKFVRKYESKKEKLGDINFYYFEPTFQVKAPICGIIGHQDPNQIYIFSSPKHNRNYIGLSARNTSQRRDMAKLLRAGVKGLQDASAGGHVSAAGGQILAKDLDKFKENIITFLNDNNDNTL